jgi:hypothetical protein
MTGGQMDRRRRVGRRCKAAASRAHSKTLSRVTLPRSDAAGKTVETVGEGGGGVLMAGVDGAAPQMDGGD